MSFLDSVVLPNNAVSTGALPRSGESFLDNVVLPENQNVANKQAGLASQYQVAKANSDYASSFMGTIKNTFSDIGNKIVGLGKTAYQALISPLQATGQAGAEVGTALREGKPAEVIAGGLKLGTGIVSSALAPISTAFAVAEKIPVLKQAADILNLPFMVTGKLGEFAGDKFTDALPISQQTRDILRPAIKEVGSLAGQVWLGGKVLETLGSKGTIDKSTLDTLKEEAKTITPESAPVQATLPIAPTVKGGFLENIALPQTDFQQELKKFGYSDADIAELVKLTNEKKEPKTYPIVNNLPEIKPVTIKPETKIYELKIQINSIEQALNENSAKKLAKYANKNGELPEVLGGGHGGTISKFGMTGDQIVTELGFADSEQAREAYAQYRESREKLKELKSELLSAKGESFTEYTPEQIDRINTLLNQATEGARPLTPVPSTGKVLPSKLAAGVEENAIEKKLTKSLGDLPEYNRVSMKQQAQFAAELLTENPEQAMRVAMGEELPPHHILPEAIFTAIENQAIKAGDVETLRKLATESNLSTQATAMGQRIRALGERDQESPVGIIREVKKAREANVRDGIDKAQKATIDAIKAEIKKSTSKRPSWEEFINSVKCNY